MWNNMIYQEENDFSQSYETWTIKMHVSNQDGLG